MNKTNEHESRIKSIYCILLFALLLLSACGSTEFVNGTNGNSITDSRVSDFAEMNNENQTGITDTDTGSASMGADTMNTTAISDENSENDNDDRKTELQKYIAMYEEDEITLDELDVKRAELRDIAAKPYETQILNEYSDIYAYNNSVIGHIHIDDTVIDAPVLQTLEDYEYYLHRDIDGVESEPGCIILDADSEIGIGTSDKGYLYEYEPTPIQLVHGHNMRNGTMFGSLLKYENEAYGLAHNLIYYDSIYEKREYELVCAFYSQIYPEDAEVFKYYDIEGINTPAKAYEWYMQVKNLALYMTDTEVKENDELIVLSTCSYQVENGRFAVVGKRIK